MKLNVERNNVIVSIMEIFGFSASFTYTIPLCEKVYSRIIVRSEVLGFSNVGDPQNNIEIAFYQNHLMT